VQEPCAANERFWHDVEAEFFGLYSCAIIYHFICVPQRISFFIGTAAGSNGGKDLPLSQKFIQLPL
jgi:hypothetical protein